MGCGEGKGIKGREVKGKRRESEREREGKR